LSSDDWNNVTTSSWQSDDLTSNLANIRDLALKVRDLALKVKDLALMVKDLALKVTDLALKVRDLALKVIYIIIGTVGVVDNLFVLVVFVLFIKITDKV